MIGKKISNYVIKEFIAEGGMGSVYLCEHETLGWKAAVKILHPEYAVNKEVLARFTQEAKTLSELKHPNIVEILDFGVADNQPFLIMEFVEGQPLDEYIEKVTGPIDENDAISIMNQVLDAIQLAHENNIIHRDLKPSNIIINRKKEIKILDFGIAKKIDDSGHQHTRIGQKLGTLPYMSPEQIRGIARISFSTDIYSLGVLLHQIVSGKPPYSADLDEFELSKKIAEEPLPRIKDIYPNAPSFFQGIVDKATAKSTFERFKTCDEFKGSLLKKINRSEKNKPETPPKRSNPIIRNIVYKFMVFGVLLTIVLILIGRYYTKQKKIEKIISHIQWVRIPSGSYLMGSPKSEEGRDWRKEKETQRSINIENFIISKYEITFAQYDEYCVATGHYKPDDNGWGRGNRPVMNISWKEANEFAHWLGCRLPTESEWEYACRAGKVTPFNTGYNLTTSQANYNGNFPYRNYSKGSNREKTLPVGNFPPNAWGLYDMHGNVSEYCENWYSQEGDPIWYTRMFKGGSYESKADECRSAFKDGWFPESRGETVGIRLVYNPS